MTPYPLNLLQAATVKDPISMVWEQFMTTGVVGACAVLFGVLWFRQIQRQDKRETEHDQLIQALQLQLLTREDAYRQELLRLSQQFFGGIKELTDQVMNTLVESSAAATKQTEVLRQVVITQQEVERLLSDAVKRPPRPGGSHGPL